MQILRFGQASTLLEADPNTAFHGRAVLLVDLWFWAVPMRSS